MKNVKTIRDEIQAASDVVSKAIAEAGPDSDWDKVTLAGDDIKSTQDKVDYVMKASADAGRLAVRLKAALRLEAAESDNENIKTMLAIMDRPANELAHVGEVKASESKTFGEAFMDVWTGQKDTEIEIKFDTKTLFATTAGIAPFSTPRPGFITSAQAQLNILDFVRVVPTDQAAITYYAETTYTNNAAEVAEGGLYPESAFELTLQTSTARKVAHFVPVTDEQLEDVDYAMAYIDGRLRDGVRRRLNSQILVGDGTAPNLSGILDRSGIQTQALGADPVPDAVFKAITKVRVTGDAEPDAVVLNANDWQGIRLLRTTDGIYIWGNPSDSGAATIWGKPVVLDQGLTENTGLVGDFGDYAELAVKRDLNVKVSDSHADYFIYGKQAIRADIRAALQVYREAAFCQITGI